MNQYKQNPARNEEQTRYQKLLSMMCWLSLGQYFDWIWGIVNLQKRNAWNTYIVVKGIHALGTSGPRCRIFNCVVCAMHFIQICWDLLGLMFCAFCSLQVFICEIWGNKETESLGKHTLAATVFLFYKEINKPKGKKSRTRCTTTFWLHPNIKRLHKYNPTEEKAPSSRQGFH